MRNFFCSVLALFCLQALAAPDKTATRRAARMAWWREARFGMFIHYGPVTLTGKEISWSRANSNTNCPNKGPTPVEVYDNLYKEFNPTNFNAADWAGVAKAAGMKYVVLDRKTLRRISAVEFKSGRLQHHALRRSSAIFARSWRRPRARLDCVSAGIFRRWTGATRIVARRTTPFRRANAGRTARIALQLRQD